MWFLGLVVSSKESILESLKLDGIEQSMISQLKGDLSSTSMMFLSTGGSLTCLAVDTRRNFNLLTVSYLDWVY